MLPSVSAALARFISPVSDSNQRTVGDGRGQSPYEGDKRQKKESAEKTPSVAPVIPIHQNGTEQVPIQQNKNYTGVTLTLIQLIDLLRSQRSHLNRWIGHRSYRETARIQRQASNARKGSMIDQKVE